MADSDDDDDDGGGGGGDAPWMATFADLSTLLLTFFVLMLSFANMDVTKFREILGSVKEAFGYQKIAYGSWNPTTMSVKESQNPQTPGEQTDEEGKEAAAQDSAEDVVMKMVQEVIQQEGLDQMVAAMMVGKSDGFIIRVNDPLFFKKGGAKLRRKSFIFLEKISKVFRRFPYRIIVEGHTDDVRPRGRFASNWALSTQRAISVMRYVTEVGGIDPSRIGVAGYAHMRPIDTNETAEGRARNRRVEFVCHRSPELQGTGYVEPVEAGNEG